MTDIIRTKRDGCWQVRSNAWGSFIQQMDDPLATCSLDKDAQQSFELNAGITPIPAELWSRWIKLCFHFVGTVRNEVEVSCRFLRHEDDKSQWRILVPAQDVDGASVRVESFDQAIDIATGEIIASYPPPGWIPCGSSHSHNTMGAFFSGTDDRYELGDPGLHIVVGNIDLAKRTYVPKASITANHRRFLIDAAAVVDLAPLGCDFHPDVLQLINHEHPVFWKQLTPPATGGTTIHNTRSLFTNPNAGNGYRGDDNDWSLFHQDHCPDGLLFNHGIVQQLQQHASKLLRTGKCDALNDLLWELSDLHAHFADQLLDLETDDPATDDGTSGAHSTPARGLPAGDW